MEKKKITEMADKLCQAATGTSGNSLAQVPATEIQGSFTELIPASEDQGDSTAPASATEKSVESDDSGKNNDHNRDISSKEVFRDPVLCAQFFRDNFEIPVLKNVQPEDIEDISERFIPYLGTEFDADTVKRIRILDINRKAEHGKESENKPPFLVSLIDHKSVVDYDAAMQLLRYMMCIWTEYRREMEAKSPGCTSRKKFRYPVILPIIYYEGKAGWTADRTFKDRIADSAEYRNWIPDFRYEVVRIHDYSNDALLERGDEMSLIMLINKIQDASDLGEFIHIPPQELNKIVQDSPGHVLDRVVEVMENLCFKINASEEERMQCVRKVRKREMGYLFENMEHIDIQEERRKLKEERKKADEERKKADEERKKADEERKKAEAERQRAQAERQRADEERKKADEERKKADEERKKADEERKKADEERKKADEERKKAEAERQRAEAERLRADSAEEKLRLAEETIRQLRKGNI